MKTDQTPPENVDLVPIARERHQGALLRYANRLLGGDPARAREVVEAALAELKAQPAGEVEDELAAWLFSACRGRAFGILQREGRMKRFESGDAEKNGGAAATASDGAESEEPHLTMQRLVDRLTPKQQEALRLKFQDGFGAKEIARITDLSPTNAGNLMHNAIARLGREFREARASDEINRTPHGGPDDARLTLFALGEMEDDERKRFEKSIFDRKTAGARIDEIREICSVIEKTLAIEAGAPAPRPPRQKKAKRRSGLAAWLGFPRVLVLLGGVAAAIAAVMIFLVQRSAVAPGASPATTVDFRLKAAPWQEPPAIADASPGVGNAGGNGGASPSPARGRSVVLHPAAKTFSGEDGAGQKLLAESGDGNPDGVVTGEVDLSVSAVAKGGNGGVIATSSRAEMGDAATGSVSTESAAANETVVDQSRAPASAATDPASAPSVHPGARRGPPGPANGGAKKELRRYDPAKISPISNLPADVGVKSVIDLKRSLAAGRWPAAGTVRAEEMLNYFPYRYAAPAAPADFAPAMESAEAPWAPTHRLVRIGLKAREAPRPTRAGANLVLLIDTSGSMAAPNRLPLVKEAARLVLNHLQPDDRVGIVTYAGESRLTLVPTPAAERRQILEALDRLEARGMTNGGAGLELAYDLARAHAVKDGVNCVILCTDGDFNVGPTGEEDLARLIDRHAKSEVTLSIFGFGRNGRIDPRLEALAAHGRGGSGYVNTRREAEQVLTAQLNGLFEPVAKDVAVRVTFNPAAVSAFRLIGYEDRAGEIGTASARPASVVLPGQMLTALYEVELKDDAKPATELLDLEVNYVRASDGTRQRLARPLGDSGTSFRDASLDFKFAAAVAAFGMVLNDSPPGGSVTLDQVGAWGRECLGDDSGGYRSEFLALVEQARAAQH